MPKKGRKKIGCIYKKAVRKKIEMNKSEHEDHTYCLDPSEQPCEFEDMWDEAGWEESVHSFFRDDDFCQRTLELDELIDSDGTSANEFYVVLDKVYMYHPDEDLDLFMNDIQFNKRFSTLRETVRQQMFKNYTLVEAKDSIKLVQFYPSEQLSIKLTVCVNSSRVVSIYVHRQLISFDNDFWLGLSSVIYKFADLQKVLDKLDSFHVCVGNWEEQYTSLIPEGALLTSPASTAVAYRESDFCASYKDIQYSSTIRSTRCKFLTRNGDRCQQCAVYRGSLRKKVNRASPPSSPETPSPRTQTHSNMTRDQLLGKIENLKHQVGTAEREVAKMRRSILKIVSVNGQCFSEATNEELMSLVESHTKEVHKSYPDENSLQRIFWDEQLKYNKLKDKHGMRWHPMIVKWSLYLQHKSPKTYEALKDSGFISLPSSRTLFDYTHALPNDLGVNLDVTRHLISEMQGLKIRRDDHTSYVGLLQDEIKVKEGLVYDSSSDELVGFTDLDKTGNELRELEHIFKQEKKKLATSMLVVMVRGITTNLKYPFAAYATQGVTADGLYSIIWNCVRVLEIDCGLKVLFVTCDGASPNRKFFSMHKEDNAEIPTYYTWNTYAAPRRKLFFISDVPHLIKTTRNCFANSYSHKLSRKLWKDGRDISWVHIVNLFENYCESNLYRMCPKLTRAHIDLTAFSQMKVNLAAQVLSKTVANALSEIYGDQVSETVKFINHVNRFFDCLNVRSPSEGIRKRNPDLNMYCESDDPRLDYLLNDFLGYFESWKESIGNRPGDFTKSQKSGMILSHQTLDGLSISVKSIVESVKFMLSEGAEYVLTHRFNQDPLEEHFAHFRYKGGCNDNPTVYQVRNTLCTMRTVGSQALATVRGNISNKRNGARTVSDQPLPKKQRKH